MSRFTLHIEFPAGGPLIGGYSAVAPGLHAAHATRPGPDGQTPEPYLPATAVRGALREALEALVRGAERRACSRGTGLDPEQPAPAPDQPRPKRCTLGEDGGPCLPCLLFGSQGDGLRPGARAFSGLVLGDAGPVGVMDWTVRSGVSISRPSRTGAEKRLYFQRLPAATAGRPLVFAAGGRLLDAELQRALEAAVRATTHIGAGRSRGLARVELRLDWHPDESAVDEAPALPEDGNVLVRATLTTPALVGAAIVDQNFRESRHEVPGSAVRGAVGFALAELLAEEGHAEPENEPGMQALIEEAGHGGARFGFLHPVEGEVRDLVGPLPITARACKHAKRAHGVVDVLLDRLVLAHADSAAAAERAAALSRTCCPVCQAPLRGADGTRQVTRAPRKRTITRVALERRRGSAADGELFTQILLERGTVLAGTIRHIPAAGRARLVQALRSGRVSFGRGRSMGWGRAAVELAPAPAPASLEERAENFDRALRARLEAAELPTGKVGHLVPITLLAPLWPPAGRGGDDLFRRALDADGYFLKARRYTRDGAWDQRRGAMQPCWSIAAGAVFVVDLGPRDWCAVLECLRALERDGLGERRHQGYGHLICFDPHITLDDDTSPRTAKRGTHR